MTGDGVGFVDDDDDDDDLIENVMKQPLDDDDGGRLNDVGSVDFDQHYLDCYYYHYCCYYGLNAGAYQQHLAS